MKQKNYFVPPPGLKSPHIQSVLASARFRAALSRPVIKAAREQIISTSDGVRLQGFYSPRPEHDKKGLVLLIHGWEGSCQSTYVRSTTRFLFDQGFEVFRLNLRDHGQSHHLNRGLFFGTLFNEVYEAVSQVSKLAGDLPFFVAGFSLGGNYALRIAREVSRRPIGSLCHVVAVSPVLDPGEATNVVDQTLFYRFYFLKKWKRSLKTKQQLYPDLYDFSDVLSHDTILGLTARLLPEYSPFERPKDYFRTYTLTGSALKNIGVATTIITSKDDPIIPVKDFYELRLNSLTRLVIHNYGGHNGFITSYTLNVWYEKAMEKIFSNNAHLPL
jgi:hypothetical protein